MGVTRQSSAQGPKSLPSRFSHSEADSPPPKQILCERLCTALTVRRVRLRHRRLLCVRVETTLRDGVVNGAKKVAASDIIVVYYNFIIYYCSSAARKAAHETLASRGTLLSGCSSAGRPRAAYI